MGTPAPEPQIQLTGQDRLSQREQIEGVLGRVKGKGEPLRVRLPFTLYDYDTARGYTFVRDASWNLQLPSEHIVPETIERLIYTIGQCMTAIAREGTEKVLQKIAPDLTPEEHHLQQTEEQG